MVLSLKNGGKVGFEEGLALSTSTYEEVDVIW